MITLFNIVYFQKRSSFSLKFVGIISVLILIFTIYAQGQSDFRAGYYITWENDTINGLIDFRGETRNSRICKFKASVKSEPQIFSPIQIKAYRFINSKFYVSKYVEIDGVEEQVFLEFLVNGIQDLYYLNRLNSFKYFIDDKNGNLIELVNEVRKVYVEGEGLFQKQSYQYIGYLKALLIDCPEIHEEIDIAHYNHKSLIKIIKNYHNYVCDDEQCIIYSKKIPIIKTKIAITGGISHSGIYVKNYFSNSNKTTTPVLGINFDVSVPEINEKLSINLIGEIGKNKHQNMYVFIPNNKTIHKHLINYNPLDFYGGLKYTYPKKTIRPTIFIGAGTRYLLDIETVKKIERINTLGTSIETYEGIKIDNILFGYIGAIGFEFIKNNKNKAFIKLAYKRFNGSTFNHPVSTNSLNFILGIYLK